MQHLLRSLLVAVMAFAACASHAQWRFESKIDPMTDFEGRVALTVVPEFGAFALYRVPEGTVMLNLRLFPGNPELFVNEPVMIRFDKHPAHTFSPPSKDQVNAPRWRYDPRGMEIQVWHGNTARGTNAFIKQLMTSSEALVRYRLLDGSNKDVRVSLEGAAEVVARAMGLPPPANSVVEEKPEYEPTVWSTSFKRCREGPDVQACIQKFLACYADFRGNDALLLACAQR